MTATAAEAPASQVRTVFAPSPIGPPSLGLIRTAVFNWALARHHHGAFVVRMEDTDRALVRDEFYDPLLDTLRWLGLDWDEGPGVGGPHEPYLQAERTQIHLEVAQRLLAAGELYESFSTPEEVAGRQTGAGGFKARQYDNGDRNLSWREKVAFLAQGRRPSLRLRLPAGEIVFDDLIRGQITFSTGDFTDPVLVRSTGEPAFSLANPVDDAMMNITHSFRGEDLLPSAPRQMAVYAALQRIGVARTIPRIGHLAMIRDAEGNPLSARRVPEANMQYFPEHGWAPDALVNYLASIGWSHPKAVSVYSRTELAAAFEVSRVKARSARLDVKQMASLNVSHLRAMDVSAYVEALIPYVQRARSSRAPLDDAECDTLRQVAGPLRDNTRTLRDAAETVGFLFDTDESVAHSGAITAAHRAALVLVETVLEKVSDWTAETLARDLREGLDGGARKLVFSALRLTVTGRPATPILFEGIAVLGREATLRRIALAIRSPHDMTGASTG